jgi:hypothetical protein
VRTGFWWGNLREGGHWGDPGVDGKIILRRIFGKWDVGVWTGLGPKEDQNSWRIRTNDELQAMYNKPNIVTTIKVRMGDERPVKKVFLGKPGGRRNVGRPKLRWLDCTENDLKSMDVNRWRKKAEGRSVMGCHSEGAMVKL